MLDFERFTVLTFDCYGTLIDWESGIVRAVRSVLSRHGVEAEDDEILETYADLEAKHESGVYVSYREVLRRVMKDLAARFGARLDPGEPDCLGCAIADWEPFSDTVDALRRLGHTYKLAVISNVDNGLFALTARRLAVRFEWVVTAERARAYKPSHEVFERALAEIARPRETVLHVAQSVYHDIIPARALGLATVWVDRRALKSGPGATPHGTASADLEVPDLATLARLAVG
jgi:2-haloacid dehalogenase